MWWSSFRGERLIRSHQPQPRDHIDGACGSLKLSASRWVLFALFVNEVERENLGM
jgi:hypothetical protein